LTWWERTKARSDQKYFMYASQGIPMGIVAFKDIDTIHQYAFWAFYASPEAPKGTGSKMEFLALEHAFNHMRLHKLCCEVLEFNKPVIKLHEKFGFTVEGVFRQQHKVDDKFISIYRLGILADEWQEKRETMIQKLIRLSS
jgi:UDP-4-amino-4,6-dideoxy-N-acetyl-beta-L-altrosamine N-acetyltransferase